ncbi:MAG TPA: ATP-binding protein [Steroidobacteraceae bacterium]|nr:ATP-binding protein [Steroidobacteraceae bacterium]
MFVGRQNELTLLHEELTTDRASLAIVYGRRRIGKSTLIREAIKDRTHVFYQATRVTSSLNLESFKAEVAHGLGADDLLTGLGDWLAVLHYLARAAEKKPGLTIVLDEFPYLVDADPALPSIIQKFWDSGAVHVGNLKLLLCGSMIAQMEELLAERNPLYGRKTLVLDLGPLSFREAAQFVRYSAEDKLLTCSVFGGTPFYLELLRGSESVQSNIIRLLLTQTGGLVDEPVVLLQSELREVSRYASILAAIADGCTKHGEIIGRVKEINDSKALSPYLEKLERMRLVRIVRSMDAAPKERDRRYFIADPLIAFWHRFVRPNLSSVAQGFGQDVWKLQIAPHLDEFMGGAFEEICREHARRFSRESFAAPAQEIGRIWHADFDIDVAGRLLDGSMIYGECKWWKDPVGENVLDQLIERASLTSYGRDNPKRQFILYSRAGFTSGLQKRAILQDSIVLHTPQSMLRGAEKGVRKRKRPRTAQK